MSRLLQGLLRLAAFLYLVLVTLAMGLALVPGLALVRAGWESDSLVLLGLSIALGYLVFGLSFLVLIVLARQAMFFRARAGDHPFLSLYTLRWAMLGTMVGLAKLVILNFLLGNPVLNVFYRLMGARIGHGVVINTCNVFDFDLISVGDRAVLGGDAVVIGHVGEGGVLHLAPVTIGRDCTVGQSAIVFPGAVMEDGSVLGALSLLPKDRRLPAGTRWGGNPLVELDGRTALESPPRA
jgi:non-ribosomal peptide synthetase-like protein